MKNKIVNIKTSKKGKNNEKGENSSEIVVDKPNEVYFWGNDFCDAVEEKQNSR